MPEAINQEPQGKILGTFNTDGSSPFEFAITPSKENNIVPEPPIIKDSDTKVLADGTVIKPDIEDIDELEAQKKVSTKTTVKVSAEGEEENLEEERKKFYSKKGSENSKENKEVPENKENIQESPIKTLFTELQEKGILDLPEDFKGEDDEEILDVWQQNLENKSKELVNELFNNNPQKDKAIALFNFLKNGGDVDTFTEAFSNPLSGLDKENESDQERVVKTYLERTTRLSPEKIQARIQRLKDTATLKEEADEAFEQLELIQKESQEQLIKEQENLVKQQQLERESSIKEIRDFVNTNDAILDYMPIKSKKEKQEFLDYLFKPTVKLNNQMVSKAYADDVNADVKSYLAEKYLKWKQFNLGSIEKKVETNVRQKLTEKLNGVSKDNARIKGEGRVIEEEEILNDMAMTEEQKRQAWESLLKSNKKSIF